VRLCGGILSEPTLGLAKIQIKSSVGSDKIPPQSRTPPINVRHKSGFRNFAWGAVVDAGAVRAICELNAA
jgi:hypothetical protein